MVAASMAVFIGMAAFAVDLGWIYLQSTNVKKAAESSALAAVVHMPLEVPQAADTVIVSGIAAKDAADAISAEHGYTALGTTVRRWAKPAQVRVDISSSTNTFFLQFFGIDTISLNRHAIAEQLPPLKLGGDTTLLGTRYRNDGTLHTDLEYWLGINGERHKKEEGDPFATRCVSANCGGTPNDQHRSPSYYYAVDVSADDVGEVIRVKVYDGSNDSGGLDYTDDLYSGGNEEFTFRLIKPDATPGDPTDNFANAGNTYICSRTFVDDDGSDAWKKICNDGQSSFVPTSQGIHVLELIVDGGGEAINGYSLKINASGSSLDGTTLYGLGYLSLWMRDVGSSPTLQVVRLDEVYAGTQLIISAFDLGDITGTALADVTFGGALSSMDCMVRVFPHTYTNPSDWGTDDAAGAPCKLTTKNSSAPGNQGIYNNEWVEFRFDVPADYTCSGNGCWATVTYNFNSGNPTDRTTWGARINGTPIHLLNETTPSS